MIRIRQTLMLASIASAIAFASGCKTMVHHTWSDEEKADFVQSRFTTGMTPDQVTHSLKKVKGREVVTDSQQPNAQEWNAFLSSMSPDDRAYFGSTLPGQIAPTRYSHLAERDGWSGPRLMQATYRDMRPTDRMFHMAGHRPWLWFAFDESDRLAQFGLVDPDDGTKLVFP